MPRDLSRRFPTSSEATVLRLFIKLDAFASLQLTPPLESLESCPHFLSNLSVCLRSPLRSATLQVHTEPNRSGPERFGEGQVEGFTILCLWAL